MRMPISVFPKIYIESFATISREEAFHENCQSALKAISRVTSREAYPQNERFFSF